MFQVRKYEEGDLAACAVCLLESFFDCPVTERDMAFLCDYAEVLIEKCSFTYVAVCERTVVGFISGHYNQSFDRALAARREAKAHFGVWARCFFKFAFGGYKLSPAFKEQFSRFYLQIKEGRDAPLACDCELMALCSRKNYRRGLGTALWNAFFARVKGEGASCIRLFTNTDASYTFYERRGFSRVWERPYSFGGEGSSLVYEYTIPGVKA